MKKAIPKTIKALLERTKDSSFASDRVVVKGWLESIRFQKQNTFLQLNDGSCREGIQAVADSQKLISMLQKDSSCLSQFTKGSSNQELLPYNGACLELEGDLVLLNDKRQNCEIVMQGIKVYGNADPTTYPLHKGRIPLEHLRQFPHLRSKSKTFAAIWRVRSGLLNSIHAFFQKNEFTQTNPPILTANDCEGGGEAFQVVAKLSSQTQKSFFNKPVYATVSSQLHLEFLMAGLSRVYTIGPCFRAEPSDSSRHLAEFWMLEAEMAFIMNLEQLIDLIEAQIQSCFSQLLSNNISDLLFFDSFYEKGLVKKLERYSKIKFGRITYLDTVKMLQESGISFQYPVVVGHALQSEHEKYVADQFEGPVFITEYPGNIKPFYMKQNLAGMALCTDLIFPKWGEIVGGSLREDEYDMLSLNLDKHHLNRAEFEWYLDLRRYGSCPHGGYGLGIERLLGLVTGISNIRDLIPAPRFLNSCSM